MAAHGKASNHSAFVVFNSAIGIVNFLNNLLGKIGFKFTIHIKWAIHIPTKSFPFWHYNDYIVLVSQVFNQHFVRSLVEPIIEMATASMQKIQNGISLLITRVAVRKHYCSFIIFIHHFARNG